MIRIVLMVMIFLCSTTGAVLAENNMRVERVQFELGKNNAVIESSISGYATVDYVLGARQGQYMNVSMASDNGANYFNILAPGEDQVAIFNGSINGNQYEGVLPESGDYKVRVYMMRSAARRNEVAHYRLETIISSAEQQTEVSKNKEISPDAAERAGMGDFDANGK